MLRIRPVLAYAAVLLAYPLLLTVFGTRLTSRFETRSVNSDEEQRWSPFGRSRFERGTQQKSLATPRLDILNSTLGFQKVFLINLETRADRLDAFALQAAAIGMDFTVVPGVIGSTIPDKALPHGMSRSFLADSELGCWRAHLNIYQMMITQNIQSALIFEDDADFDLALKYQMVDFAKGTKFLLQSKTTFSPYSDDWDILWIGHNRVRDRRYVGTKRWVSREDPTVIPPDHRTEVEKADMSAWDDQHVSGTRYTRITFIPTYAEASTGYALSLHGAAEILYHESLQPFSKTVDSGIGHFCESPGKYSNFTCVAPYPKLVGQWIPAGAADKDTDNGHVTHEDANEASSSAFMFSTRMNLEKVILGQDLFEAQYADEVILPKMSVDDIAAGIHGHAEQLLKNAEGKFVAERISNVVS